LLWFRSLRAFENLSGLPGEFQRNDLLHDESPASPFHATFGVNSLNLSHKAVHKLAVAANDEPICAMTDIEVGLPNGVKIAIRVGADRSFISHDKAATHRERDHLPSTLCRDTYSTDRRGISVLWWGDGKRSIASDERFL